MELALYFLNKTRMSKIYLFPEGRDQCLTTTTTTTTTYTVLSHTVSFGRIVCTQSHRPYPYLVMIPFDDREVVSNRPSAQESINTTLIKI